MPSLYTGKKRHIQRRERKTLMIMRLMPTPDVHPHPDSWHPAGTAVCLSLFNMMFTELIFCLHSIVLVILTKRTIKIIEYT